MLPAAGRSQWLNFALGEQHGGKQVMEHGLSGLAGETLLAELARLFALAGIKGGGGATNNVLGGVPAHGSTLEQRNGVATRRHRPRRRTIQYAAAYHSVSGGGDYWKPAGAVIGRPFGRPVGGHDVQVRCSSGLSIRHSGAMRSIEPGISRFPDVQLHI
jgi:hypothetical protein